jgi:hypothetical protein
MPREEKEQRNPEKVPRHRRRRSIPKLEAKDEPIASAAEEEAKAAAAIAASKWVEMGGGECLFVC